MHKKGIGKFPYFVGVNSLAEVATREDRVCVLNILGTESRSVTPTSHEYSGGNVVFGTSPGRTGHVLPTKLGPIPVYNSVKEGLAAGHRFNTGVVYLPPTAVKDGVAEMVGHNKELKKVIIVTEKISVKDAGVLRAICQVNGTDVFGGNSLGVADAWNQVRMGGALGGSKPEESLIKGSIAIFSNSGNFTTTIAVYLTTNGWGTTTSISSGKDIYIHFGPGEFFHAMDNDDRSKGAVLYGEPGGYYEHGLQINKPTVACVVGRWKAKLTKACGHAGSLAGSGDDARAKERWFMNYFGVDSIYTPTNPVFSKKGAVVTNIAHIPEALTKVMESNGIKPDFEPRGTLSLKCWFGNNQGLALPEELDMPIVEAVAPYNEQIKLISQQVGAQFPRQNLKDASGASIMSPTTQVSKIHNVSVLDASKYSLGENLVFSLVKSYPNQTEKEFANIALTAYVNMCGDPAVAASDAAREAEASPNTAISTAVGIIGKGRVKQAKEVVSLLLELFQHEKIAGGTENFDYSSQLQKLSSDQKKLLTADEKDTLGADMFNAIGKMGGKSPFVGFVIEAANKKPSSEALFGAICATFGWTSLIKRKISKSTLTNLPWYFRIFSTIVGAAVPANKHEKDSFCGVNNTELMEKWSFTEVAFLSLAGRRPTTIELFEFTLLLGLIITNGPGTISAQGCKGAVSADGPEQPERIQINKAMIGFLTHTGFAHGGNGYEAIAFLMDQFKDSNLKDPGNRKHGIDLKNIACNYAKWYAGYKKKEKEAGNIDYRKIPCINHPVFKGKKINIDPREEFVSRILEERGSYNVFLDFYHHLVQELFDTKVTANVYCVNVDAVIAVILLKIFWGPLSEGKISNQEVETAAFTTFLYGRMIGCAAETDDHLNRGRNMDTRTPASAVSFVG